MKTAQGLAKMTDWQPTSESVLNQAIGCLLCFASSSPTAAFALKELFLDAAQANTFVNMAVSGDAAIKLKSLEALEGSSATISHAEPSCRVSRSP